MGQWRGAFMFSLICAWINGWVNKGEAGDLRRYRAHYIIIVMQQTIVNIDPNLCRHMVWLDSNELIPIVQGKFV